MRGAAGLMDLAPRTFPAESLAILCNLAELVVRELERDRVRRGGGQESGPLALSSRALQHCRSLPALLTEQHCDSTAAPVW